MNVMMLFKFLFNVYLLQKKWKKEFALSRDWTTDLSLTRRTLYHWASKALTDYPVFFSFNSSTSFSRLFFLLNFIKTNQSTIFQTENLTHISISTLFHSIHNFVFVAIIFSFNNNMVVINVVTLEASCDWLLNQ